MRLSEAVKNIIIPTLTIFALISILVTSGLNIYEMGKRQGYLDGLDYAIRALESR